VSATRTRSGATRLVEVFDVEHAGLPQTGHVPQGSVLIDEASQGSLDCCPDRVGAGHRTGAGEEFIVDLDKSLGHAPQYIHSD
jgi:hypothetical protein